MGRTSSKRRDLKGRVLGEGEYQKPDGKYEYRYRDKFGELRSVYSWRLTASDATPAGKRPCEPLRDMAAKINRALSNNIDVFTSSKATLNERFDLYISGKINLKPSTRGNYTYMYDSCVRDTLGRLKIADINYSLLKTFYTELITKRGFKPNSVDVIHTILNPVFEIAAMDDIIPKNHCTKVMKELRDSGIWKREKRMALTLEQQKAFMNFLLHDKRYSEWGNIITVLLGTGMRIGECLGLTWNECLFDSGAIVVDHTLLYRKDEQTGKCMHRVMFSTKTESGERSIPMMDEVREALLAEKERQERVGTANTVIDGMSGWVFTNRYGTVFTPKSINAAIARICKAYNQQETEQAAQEGRKAILLPHFTCHHLRHTFCTRLVEIEPNVKVVQAIMGHADISTTMDIYADVEERMKRESKQRVQGKLFIR